MFRIVSSAEPARGGGGALTPVQEEPPDQPGPPEQPRQSPLTYAKVFGAIPRVTGVNTPNINHLVAQKWGLPFVTSSEDFRKSYAEGREILRYVRHHFLERNDQLSAYCEQKPYKFSEMFVW